MNHVTVSTASTVSIRVKGKTFLLALRSPNRMEIYGYDIPSNNPLILDIINPDGDDPFEFDYTDEFIWESVKAHKKAIKKAK